MNEEELSKERKEILKEMDKIDKERFHHFKKVLLIIIIVLLAVFLFIKLFFGTIEIYNVFGYPSNNARYYYVEVNNEHVAVSYTTTQTIPIVPYLIHFNSIYHGNSYIAGDDTGSQYFLDSNKLNISIKSYSCYNNNIQVECTNNGQTMTLNDDEKFIGVRITRTTNPYEVVYDGNYITDLSSYITEKGVYCVEITSKKGLVQTVLYFYVNKV